MDAQLTETMVTQELDGPFKRPRNLRTLVRSDEYGLKKSVYSVGSRKRTRSGEAWKNYAVLLENTCVDERGLKPLLERIEKLENRVEDLKDDRRKLKRTLRLVTEEAREDLEQAHELVDKTFGMGTMERLLAKQ